MSTTVWNETALALAIVAIVSGKTRSGAEVARVVSHRVDGDPSRSAIYKTLNRLEERGYVTQTDSEYNDRANQYTATEEGSRAVGRFAGNMVGWIDRPASR